MNNQQHVSPGGMLKDMVNTQMMFSLMQGVGGGSPVQNMILMSLYEKVVATFPVWFPALQVFCCRRQKTPPATAAPPPDREVRCTIECQRIVAPAQGSKQGGNGQGFTIANHSKMDSVIHYITTIPVIRNLLCITHHDYLPNEFEPIQIEPDLYFKLTDMRQADGVVESFKFKLFCYDHEVQYLQAFVDRCSVDYDRRMANKLGTNLFYFDMMTDSKNKNSIQNKTPNTHIMYTKNVFQTARSFDNVFFEQLPKVRKHVEFFLTQKEWYDRKGIPYTMGFLFHGDPGCGKTSTIKAIAKTARRHIINIHMSQIKSKEQLRHLFFNDDINVYNGSTVERYTIPVNERMYVIEDIDAMGDALLRREWKTPAAPVKKETAEKDAWMQQHGEDVKEPIDLSFLLNLLDGTLESSGRIIAISSNFPERIDRALIRPGRIDMIIHFKKCNRAVLSEMVTSFYDSPHTGLTDESLDYKWSPAEVNQILFRNFDTPDKAISELETLMPADLYGFDEEKVETSYGDFMRTLEPAA
jgi:hypothetical protein